MSKNTDLIQPDRGQDAIDIHLVDKDGFEDWAKRLSTPQRAALAAQKFTGGGYETAIVPDGDGWFAVGGVADPAELSSWCMAKLAEVLPAGVYRRAEGEPGPALFGWQTAQYRFRKYKDDKKAEGPRILLTKEAKKADAAKAEARAAMLVATWSTRRPRTWARPSWKSRPKGSPRNTAARSRSRAAMRWSRNSRWSTP